MAYRRLFLVGCTEYTRIAFNEKLYAGSFLAFRFGQNLRGVLVEVSRVVFKKM